MPIPLYRIPDGSAIFYLHRLLYYDPEYGQAFMKLGNVYNWNFSNYDSAKYYYHKAVEHYTTVGPRDNRMVLGYYSLGDDKVRGTAAFKKLIGN